MYFDLIKNEIQSELQILLENIEKVSQKETILTKVPLESLREPITENIERFSGEVEENLGSWRDLIIARHFTIDEIDHFLSTLRIGCSQLNPNKFFGLSPDEKQAFLSINLFASAVWNCYKSQDFPGLVVYGGEKYRTVEKYYLITFPTFDEERVLYNGILGHEIGHLIAEEQHVREEIYKVKYLDLKSYLKHWERELIADIFGIFCLGPLLPYSFLVSSILTIPILTLETNLGEKYCSDILTYPPDEIRIPFQLDVLNRIGIKENEVTQWIRRNVEDMNSFEPEAYEDTFIELKDKFANITKQYRNNIDKLLEEIRARKIIVTRYTNKQNDLAQDIANKLTGDSTYSIPENYNPITVLNALCSVKIRNPKITHIEISKKFTDYIIQWAKKVSTIKSDITSFI